VTPAFLVIILFAFGIALIVAELFLPTYGILGVLGGICIAGAIGTCFYVNRYFGLVTLIAAAIASPFIAAAVMNLWPKLPVGRRLVLQHVEAAPTPPVVFIGQTGVAVSQLRPMGECEFGPERVQCTSEHGVIESGTQIKVVALTRELPIVRPITLESTKPPDEAVSGPSARSAST
jgi:membrane-bound serine protease (ClpP class)